MDPSCDRRSAAVPLVLCPSYVYELFCQDQFGTMHHAMYISITPAIPMELMKL